MIKTINDPEKVRLELEKKRTEQNFKSFLDGLEYMVRPSLVVNNQIELDLVVSKFEWASLDLWNIKRIFREGYKDGLIDFSQNSDGRIAYLSRCLGHKIGPSTFLKFPRLSVLYSLRILKGRWKDAEEVIVKDDIAAYFYSKYVVKGILPEKMHTEIVLSTVLRKSFSIQKYFFEIEGLQRKKLCYN